MRQGDGETRLDPGVRAALESSFGVDLSGIRLHSGPRTDAFLWSRRLGAAAYGHRVFLPAAAGGDSWLHMLAHEVAHAVQQAQGNGLRGAAAELGAEAAAAAVLAGRQVPARSPLAPPRAGHGSAVLAGFNSWEHVLLGDLSVTEINSVATRSGNYLTVLGQLRTAVSLWKEAADVTPAKIIGAMPGITVMTLPNGCVATYGEVCALADYIADLSDLAMPATTMFPFLQQIRQETFNRLNLTMTGQETDVSFQGAMTPYMLSTDDLGHALEALSIDSETQGLGVNHYSGLLARNACHFAPWVWYRWLSRRTTACNTAEQARTATGPEKARLTDLAKAQLAYADHFLQDSFAAGHLTNKTLVMQYFLDWVQGKWFIPVVDWDCVRQVTLANQPLLHGQKLYDDRKFTSTPNDPQYAEEQATFAARMAATQVLGYGTVTTEQAYHQYLAFLSSSTVQLASNQVHDHFNVTGLKVASGAAQPYLAYGDENLLRSPAQVAAMAPVLSGSKGAVDSILNGWAPTKGPVLLLDVPDSAADADGKLWLLDYWNTAILKQQVPGIFKERIGAMRSILTRYVKPSLGPVSVDQMGGGLTWRWTTPLVTRGPATVLWDGQRLFAAANGVVFQLDPATGKILAANTLPDVGASEMRLASSGDVLYAGKNGYVFALSAANIAVQIAKSSQLDVTTSVVEVLLTDDGHLYASAAGYVYELDPKTLTQLGYQPLRNLSTFAARLAATSDVLVVGINHKIVCLSRANIEWVLNGYGIDFPSSSPNVAVLTVGENAWAAVGELVGPLNTSRSGDFASVLADGFDGEVRLGTDGLNVYVSGRGQLQAVAIDGTRTLWPNPVTLSPDGILPSQSTPSPILAEGGNVFASANGYVFQVDPATGRILNPTQSTVGDATTEVTMASDGTQLFCGATVGGWAVVTSLEISPK